MCRPLLNLQIIFARRTGLYLLLALLCSLALTRITLSPPLIPTGWALLSPWGIYIPQSVDYPWPSYTLQIALWVIIIGCLIGISLSFPKRGTGISSPFSGLVFTGSRGALAPGGEGRSKSSHPERWLIIFITLLGFALRLHGLQTLPLIVDEIGFAAHASDILHGQQVPIFAPGHNANPSVFSWLVAGAMALFGQNAFAIRLIPLVFGTLSVPAVYILGREWWSRPVGLIAAAFLATCPAHIFYSRMSMYNIVDPFFAMLALACLSRALKTPSSRYWILAGLFAGVAQYFYHGSRLLLILMAVYILFSALINNGTKNSFFSNLLASFASLRLNLLLLLLSFIIVTLPRFAPMFVNQLPMTGNEQAMHLPNDLDINTLRAVLAWFGKLDLSPFWMSDAPLIQWLPLIPFTLTLFISIRRWRDPRFAVLILSVLLTTIFGGAIWVSAPLFVRYMTAAPAIALMVAVGLIGKNKVATFTNASLDAQKSRFFPPLHAMGRGLGGGDILQIALVCLIALQGIIASDAHLSEAKSHIRPELWEEDLLAKQAANMQSGMAAVLMASSGFGAKPPDPRVMESIAIAHYIAAYGERRPVVLNWDAGKILNKQLAKLRPGTPFVILSIYEDKDS